MAEPKKYLLMPGSVRSRQDGDIHWISAQKLADLYGVPMRECVVWRTDAGRGRRADYPDGLILLRPDYYGNYQIPPAAEDRGQTDG